MTHMEGSFSALPALLLLSILTLSMSVWLGTLCWKEAPSKGHQHGFYSGHSLLGIWWQVLQEKWEHWVPGTLAASLDLIPLILGTGSLPLCFTPECAGFLDLGLPTLWRTVCQFQQMDLLLACQLARGKKVWAVAQQRWTGTVIPPPKGNFGVPSQTDGKLF